jgi:uncharacterized protein (TIGR00730 family)
MGCASPKAGCRIMSWIGVFAGSALGPPRHQRAVAAFGRDLAEAGRSIVYGGGRVGLMGILADAALAAGGEVVGVMPRRLVEREIAHRGLSRLEVVDSMHERKARMAELADAFVAVPGGAGTLDELFEIWTWGQLGLHAKPVALLDVARFFEPLRSQLALMSACGYLSAEHLASLGIVRETQAFLAFVDDYRRPEPKWR